VKANRWRGGTESSDQISPWRAKASPGELRRLNLLRADVAETHWGRKLNSPW